MSKTLPFTGSGVAIITPFDGLKTNYDELGKLIEYHIENNTDAIIICGTTGEASTMPDEEHLAAIKYTVEKAAGRITVIAGTGSNDTAHAIELSKKAEEYGVDGILSVTPSSLVRRRTSLFNFQSCESGISTCESVIPIEIIL